MSGGGGQVLVRKWGQVPDGGGEIDNIFADWGTPPPPRKTLPYKYDKFWFWVGVKIMIQKCQLLRNIEKANK